MRYWGWVLALSAKLDSAERRWVKLKYWFSSTTIVRGTWRLVYGRWLEPSDKVVRVLGWRSALIQDRFFGRRGMTACFWWLD